MSDKQQYAGFVARESQAQNLRADVIVVDEQGSDLTADQVSVEEPLEILLAGAGRDEMTLAITMRTPGCDDELGVGFLFSEGIIRGSADIENLEHCRPASAEQGHHNVLRATLTAAADFDPAALERHFYVSSSCGVCGKTSLDSVMAKVPSSTSDSLRIMPPALRSLPDLLETQQSEFNYTGGIHAAALFDSAGQILSVREDVGRHNALDKLIGERVLTGEVPLQGLGVLLSGRASFELVQKAAMAGIEFIAAIGPPSSLAIDLAKSSGITLVGFLKRSHFNVYANPNRILSIDTLLG